MKWELLHPDQEQAEDVPCRRAAFGGMLSYDGCVYLFGGIKVMYGRPKGPGDLSVQGSLNDLWRYDPGRGRWARLEGHDGRIGFRPSDTRPCTRKLTTWLPVNGRLYLFGGSSVRGPGKGAIKLNDLWAYDTKTASWELLEPDDGRASGIAADGHRPAGYGGMGAAVLGDTLYLMGGTWSDDARTAVDLRAAGREMGVPWAGAEWARPLAAETILSRACRLERQALPVGRSGQSGSGAGVLQRSVGIRSRRRRLDLHSGEPGG